MYSVTFEGDNGSKFLFGYDGGNVFDMDFGNGLSVNVGTSQGFSQVGKTVESMSVGDRSIKATGVLFRNINEGKRTMRKVFAPFTWGRLVFEGYFIRVCVKATPSFSPVKDDGKFSMQFLAPFPYFTSVNQISVLAGGVEPSFRFPVNYATPHTFGTRASNKTTIIRNNGDVDVPLHIHIETFGVVKVPYITNLNTRERLSISGSLTAGQSLDIYRDNNTLRAELTTDEGVQDVLSWVNEISTLYFLHVGDNLLEYGANTGESSMMVRFTYSPAVVAMYES